MLVRGPERGVLAVLIMGSVIRNRSMEVCASLNSCPGGIPWVNNLTSVPQFLHDKMRIIRVHGLLVALGTRGCLAMVSSQWMFTISCNYFPALEAREMEECA